jgi:hypothetical protein
MRVEGKCHCGNITYVLDWPGDDPEIPVRACSCDFCTMHGGTYTSNREADLQAEVNDPSCLSEYRFGTQTAVFYICSRCGGVPFVTSLIQDHLYAVVNVNTFQGMDRSRFKRSTTDFDGETTESRLERRMRTWIPNVTVKKASVEAQNKRV